MDSNQRPRSYQDCARSSSLTNFDTLTNISRSASPNPEESLSLRDYAANGYINRHSYMVILPLRFPLHLEH